MTVAGTTSLRRWTDTLRLGLCCQCRAEPVTFRATTVTAMARLPTPARLADLCRANAEALLA